MAGINSSLPPGPYSPIPNAATRDAAAVSGRSIPSQQAVVDRMAADRAARLNAMRTGGIDALDKTIASQSGAVPASRPVTNAVANSPTAAAPSAPTGQGAAYRAGQAVREVSDAAGRAARFGASPVETKPGRFGPRTAAAGAGAATFLAGSAALAAGDSNKRDTGDYRERLGMSRYPSDGIKGFAEDVGARAAGVMGDVGAGILDVPVDIANKFGANIQPFRTFFNDRATETGDWNGGVVQQGQDQPVAAGGRAASQAASQPSAAGGIQELPTMTVRSGEADDGGATNTKGRRMGYGRMVDGVATFSDGSGTGGVPRTMSDQQIADFGGQPARYQPSYGGGMTGGIAGGYQRAANAAAARSAREDSAYMDLINRDFRERSNARDRSEERLKKLYGDLDSALFRGKRRTAGVITDAIRAEAGIASGAMPGQTPDVRRAAQHVNPSDFAQADHYSAQANLNQLQADRQARINALMDTYLKDPNSDEGRQALSAMRMSEGKIADNLYPVDVQTGIDEFGMPQKMRGLADRTGRLVYNPGSGNAGNHASGGQNAGAPVEGKTYVDANGNRAVYRNGQYVPTQ